MKTLVFAITLAALLVCGQAFAEPVKTVTPVKAEYLVCERNEDCVLTNNGAVNKKYAKEYDVVEPGPDKPFGNDFAACIDKKCVVGVHF